MNSALQREEARSAGRRFDPKYAPLPVPRSWPSRTRSSCLASADDRQAGFAPNLASAWLTSFAIGVAVAIPTAILVAPSARRLAGHLTGPPLRSPPENRQ